MHILGDTSMVVTRWPPADVAQEQGFGVGST